MLKQSRLEEQEAEHQEQRIQVGVEAQIQPKPHLINIDSTPQMLDGEESDFQSIKQ